jgi:hypothetical protein
VCLFGFYQKFRKMKTPSAVYASMGVKLFFCGSGILPRGTWLEAFANGGQDHQATT